VSSRKRRPLTRERVLRAAMAVADEGGLESLTMRRLATELGVEAMSLYNHVANKEDMIDGLVDIVFGEIEPPSTDVGWRTAMRARAISTRDALRRHPWAIGLMEARSTPGRANLQNHEAALKCLREAGFSLVDTVHAYNVQDSYIYGFALQERALPALDAPGEGARVAERMLPQASVAEYPYSVEMVGEHIATFGFDFTAEFEFGLDLILDGLERFRAGARPERETAPGGS
jgi:AcrR family transcriptional regulator